MTIFDSHCHPQFPQYDGDREEMLARATAAGVHLICVGTDFQTSKRSIELAAQHENVWATVGLHPNDIPGDFDIQIYHKLMTERRVVAIGEVGLDYYRTQEPHKQTRQKEVFKEFLDLAAWYDKPVVIHSRDAGKGSTGRVHADILEIISRFYKADSKLHGVTHSFTGSVEEAKQYLELGFYLGFNGIITFPGPSGALREGGAGMYDDMVRMVPLDKILIETDAPYLTPEPYRGQRNEPAYVIEVAKKLAELKNEPLSRVIEQTAQNCRHLFKI
jgi:TatD DNase family protein